MGLEDNSIGLKNITIHDISKPRWNFARGIKPSAKKWKSSNFVIPVLPHGAFLRGKSWTQKTSIVEDPPVARIEVDPKVLDVDQ